MFFSLRATICRILIGSTYPVTTVPGSDRSNPVTTVPGSDSSNPVTTVPGSDKTATDRGARSLPLPVLTSDF